MAKRILVIEDNPANLELLTLLLEAFGYVILAASGGAEGIEVVRREKLDLIICDVQMPGVDGYEVARRLKKDPMLHRIPLVAVTALAMVGDREKVLAAGFDGYIDKPIVPEKFVKQIQAFMERPEERLSNPGAEINRS
ncbi:MAG: response regulator [Syntrophales bacterium]|nr:response regulator [Syntrophales bacterium]